MAEVGGSSPPPPTTQIFNKEAPWHRGLSLLGAKDAGIGGLGRRRMLDRS